MARQKVRQTDIMQTDRKTDRRTDHQKVINMDRQTNVMRDGQIEGPAVIQLQVTLVFKMF